MTNYSVRGTAGTSSPVILTNSGQKDMEIGQIDILNYGSSAAWVQICIPSGSPYIGFNLPSTWSRLTDTRKVPYVLKPGESITAYSGVDNSVIVHVTYMQ